MDDHDDICLCFHVSVQKLKKYIRLNKPVRDSQLSECYGAGTGCGWCRPFLKSLFEPQQQGRGEHDLNEFTVEDYAKQRKDYRRRSKHMDDQG